VHLDGRAQYGDDAVAHGHCLGLLRPGRQDRPHRGLVGRREAGLAHATAGGHESPDHRVPLTDLRIGAGVDVERQDASDLVGHGAGVGVAERLDRHPVVGPLVNAGSPGPSVVGHERKIEMVAVIGACLCATGSGARLTSWSEPLVETGAVSQVERAERVDGERGQGDAHEATLTRRRSPAR